jgi:UDP-GlcNAc:undecaprenyl-phosphate GlcNAc-1-phosphate transferase
MNSLATVVGGAMNGVMNGAIGHAFGGVFGGAAERPGVRVYALAFVLAAATSLIATYVVRERARHAGLFDRSDARKLHGTEIPRVGGVGIVLAVAITSITLLLLFGSGVFAGSGQGLLVVFAGGLAIHCVGLYDDLRQLHARWKFLAQIVIAVLVFAAGVRMTTLSLPFIRVVDLGTVAGLLFTVLWFVGITNAFNLIDGLDGLASGAALFALTTMFVVAIANGRYGAALVTLTLAGAMLGFLYFNFHPATIFLGDSGSLFVGFMLAGIGALSAQKSPTVIAVAIPVVSLGLPVLDTLIAVTRRFLRRQPIFAADRGHIHHRLLGRGYSPRTVVLALYGVCALLALAAMLLVNDGGHVVALVLVLIGVGVGFMVQRLRIYEFEEVGRLLRRGVQQRHTIERGVRVREASARIASLDDLSAVFVALGETFSEDGCPRAEVRLRATFLDGRRGAVGGRGPHRPDATEEDDVPVWTWNAPDVPNVHPTWWHVTLPFLDHDRRRFGSLVMWEDGIGVGSPFPHFHAISGDLRGQIEAKLLALWPVGVLRSGPTVPADGVHPASLGAPPGDRARARDRVPTGSGPAVPIA